LGLFVASLEIQKVAFHLRETDILLPDLQFAAAGRPRQGVAGVPETEV
jgi:hypothetical protein